LFAKLKLGWGACGGSPRYVLNHSFEDLNPVPATQIEYDLGYGTELLSFV